MPTENFSMTMLKNQDYPKIGVNRSIDEEE
jgi:hypothetical protein